MTNFEPLDYVDKYFANDSMIQMACENKDLSKEALVALLAITTDIYDDMISNVRNLLTEEEIERAMWELIKKGYLLLTKNGDFYSYTESKSITQG